MTYSELLQQLSSAGLYPIAVEGGIDNEDVRGMRFLGDIAGFVEAAKALESHCVFVASKVLQEADFFYQDDSQRYDYQAEDEDSGLASAPSPVDLTAVEPSLREHKRHLGQHCGFRLWIQVHNTTLEFVAYLPWWESFSKLREQVIEAQHQNRELAWAERAEQEERKAEELLQRLRALINDAEFVRLPTQRAMQAYAVERIPELEELDVKTLRAEIQALDAKIQAKGLGRKK